MYCCVNCGLPRSRHGIGKPTPCPNGETYYSEGDPVVCKVTECIHPINCRRRQECLSNKLGGAMSDSGRQIGDDMATGRPNRHVEDYASQQFQGGLGRQRNGSPLFYALLQTMAETHDKKSHDYASNDNPFGNYHFAGMLSKLFDNPNDAGFIGRLGEKFYRLANLENSKKETAVKDESVADTENDIAVITLLWIVDRRQRRSKTKS